MTGSTIRLRHGCFGRKWLAEHGLEHRRMRVVPLPWPTGAAEILRSYRAMRRAGLYDFQARSVVVTVMGAAMPVNTFYGLVAS